MQQKAPISVRPHPEPCVLVYEPEHPVDLPFYREALQQALPSARLLMSDHPDHACGIAAQATALVSKAQILPDRLIAAMPKLDFIQALTTGVDNVLAYPLSPETTLCNARGVHGPQMSELALMYMLALMRDLPRMLVNQQHARWERWSQRLLDGKTVAIIGLGAIATELAARCRVFGMKVIGISNARAAVEGFDEVQPRSQLAAVAARVDVLVALVPYSPETHHLIDAALLAALRPGAFLINIARGKVVDEQALIDALRSGRLAGAAVDVFATEPLPADSPLWSLPNLIITPHIGGMSDNYAQQLLPLIVHNLQCYTRGDRAAMRNIVER